MNGEPGSADASPAVSRASRDIHREIFGGAPKRVGEAPALPGLSFVILIISHWTASRT